MILVIFLVLPAKLRKNEWTAKEKRFFFFSFSVCPSWNGCFVQENRRSIWRNRASARAGYWTYNVTDPTPRSAHRDACLSKNPSPTREGSAYGVPSGRGADIVGAFFGKKQPSDTCATPGVSPGGRARAGIAPARRRAPVRPRVRARGKQKGIPELIFGGENAGKPCVYMGSYKSYNSYKSFTPHVKRGWKKGWKRNVNKV